MKRAEHRTFWEQFLVDDNEVKRIGLLPRILHKTETEETRNFVGRIHMNHGTPYNELIAHIGIAGILNRSDMTNRIPGPVKLRMIKRVMVQGWQTDKWGKYVQPDYWTPVIAE